MTTQLLTNLRHPFSLKKVSIAFLSMKKKDTSQVFPDKKLSNLLIVFSRIPYKFWPIQNFPRPRLLETTCLNTSDTDDLFGL